MRPKPGRPRFATRPGNNASAASLDRRLVTGKHQPILRVPGSAGRLAVERVTQMPTDFELRNSEKAVRADAAEGEQPAHPVARGWLLIV